MSFFNSCHIGLGSFSTRLARMLFLTFVALRSSIAVCLVCSSGVGWFIFAFELWIFVGGGCESRYLFVVVDGWWLWIKYLRWDPSCYFNLILQWSASDPSSPIFLPSLLFSSSHPSLLVSTVLRAVTCVRRKGGTVWEMSATTEAMHQIFKNLKYETNYFSGDLLFEVFKYDSLTV